MAITHNIVTRSNDTGYYTGLPYNFFVDKGQESPGVGSTVYQQAAEVMWFFKSIVKTAGWQVVAWGSGAATTGIYSDPFSSSLSMTSDHGWFMVKQPNSSRSFTFQKAGPSSASNEGSITNYHNIQYRIKYSPSGFAISGTLSAKNTPGPITASTELVVLGAGTDALPTYAKFIPALQDSSAGNTTVYHCVAQTVSPFGFALLGQYGGIVTTGLTFDPVITPNTQDTEPYVIYSGFDTSGPYTNIGNSAQMNAFTKWTWVRQDFADQVSGACIAGMSYYDFNQGLSTTNFTMGRHPGKTATFLPLLYVVSQTNGTTSSYKGISTLFKVAPMSTTPAVPMQATFSVFSLYDVAQIAAGTVVPWFGVRYEAY